MKEQLNGLLNVESIVGIGLVLALLLSIFYGGEQLSMSIATGLIGYIGRGHLSNRENEEE